MAAALRAAPPIRHVKLKTVTTLAYFGQTLLQSIHLAQGEFINAFGTVCWRRTIRSSFAQQAPASDLSLKPDLLSTAPLSSK